MTGDFRLIDYIFDNVHFRQFLWHFNPFYKKIEGVYKSLNGQVQAFFYIMASFVIQKK